MITSKGFTNKLIISIADGKKLGEIKDLYLDLDMHQVVGVYIGSEGIIRRKEKAILRSSVQVCGIDAWLVSNSDVVTTLEAIPDSATLTLVDNLRGREVQTEGGTRLGTVEDVLLDGELRVLGFELGKVYAQGPLAEKKAIVREGIKDIGGKDRPMIADLELAESLPIPTE
ncbi:MAG: PRC-barrel domain-containing protein [Chloroflexi bacterium]|nr:PRC-barrel domain-containing protein [Chloroflexota bacterium]